MKSITTLALLLVAGLSVLSIGCANKDTEKMNTELKQFLTAFEAKYAPLGKEANLAAFDASLSGKDEDYKKSGDLEILRSTMFSNKEDFAKLKKFRDSGAITDPSLKRQLDILYWAFQSRQIDEKKIEEIIRMEKGVEKKFSTFRAEVNGKVYSDNEIEDILKKSTSSTELEAAWTASKKVGEAVSADVLALVKMRNEAARSLGFKNYHAMQLELSEQDPAMIETLFDELDALTRDAFASLKGDIDTYLAKRLNLPKEQLMPWHYQNRYFQEAPKIYDVDLDAFYKDKDVVALTTKYYAGIGLPIDDMVAKSDLFEKPGKYQHAYCTDIDRLGDVRVVCNVKPTYSWMGTLLHEYGHAVYSKNMDRAMPFFEREEAHIFATEAIAMLFGRFASNPAFLKDVVGVPAAEADKVADASRKSLRLEQLVFSRWAQVMYRFEKAMYENPDQDLNTLWWDIVEKYQMIKRPAGRNAPDWASKIHIALSPCYYHNYLMGELLASQLWFHINGAVLGNADPMTQSFAGKTAVGAYLADNVFKLGRSLFWNDMIEGATGEKLTPKYYAKQFVN
ncbi:MAG: M2 family metallopeptidase [Ignavibacteria bacterium]|nr:M2 family metallopeptidase [Ignavibacteria bacterium]